MTKFLWFLRVVEGDEREKHWPPPHVKTRANLITHSRAKPNEGWLNPSTRPEDLRRFALAALAAHFFQTLQGRTEEDFINGRVRCFLNVWSELFQKGKFRLGITHTSVMGAQNGRDCRNVVYDFDLSSMQFHCFAVISFPAVREVFIEDQLDL